MGNVVTPVDGDELIVKRDEKSWLIDGKAAIEDIKNLFNWSDLPGQDHYQTLNGFLMYQMKCIPKKTNVYTFQGVKFEIVDVDNFRIDEVIANIL
jgi:CBS domain containing-hemolysin-like protein